MKQGGGRPKGVSTSAVEVETFGFRLRKLRESARLEQDEFGRLFGVSRNTQGQYERNNAHPNAVYLADVCQKFGASADWLLLGRGDMQAGSPQPAVGYDPAVMQKCSMLARHVAAGQNPPLAPQAEAQLASELYEFFMGKRQ